MACNSGDYSGSEHGGGQSAEAEHVEGVGRVPDPGVEASAGATVEIGAPDPARKHGGEPCPGPGFEGAAATRAAGSGSMGEL